MDVKLTEFKDSLDAWIKGTQWVGEWKSLSRVQLFATL